MQRRCLAVLPSMLVPFTVARILPGFLVFVSTCRTNHCLSWPEPTNGCSPFPCVGGLLFVVMIPTYLSHSCWGGGGGAPPPPPPPPSSSPHPSSSLWRGPQNNTLPPTKWGPIFFIFFHKFKKPHVFFLRSFLFNFDTRRLREEG